MNKIVKKIGIFVLAASMLTGMFAFAACGDENENQNQNGNGEHKHTSVKVDEVPASCVNAGTKAYYICECGKMFEDSASLKEITDGTSLVIAATGHDWDGGVISEDGTLKTISCRNCDETKTETVTVTTTYTITYNLNYDGAPAAEVLRYEGGVAASEPKKPNHPDNGYIFGGWYLEDSCETKYDFNLPMTANLTLYAKWKQETQYVFEAEYTKIKTLSGVGWSNEAKGLDMIMRDKGGVSGASNGFYVGYLYRNGLTLTFKINSDVAVDDATLTLRVSGEMTESIILTGDEYTVKVNDNKIDYAGISITGIDPKPDAPKHEFQDVLVTASLNLVAGENTITLTTSNGIKLGGTATATAPLVDCIKILSTSVLTWSPIESNIEGWSEE